MSKQPPLQANLFLSFQTVQKIHTGTEFQIFFLFFPTKEPLQLSNTIRSWRLMWQGCHYYCDWINSWWMNGEKVSVKVLKNNLPIKIFWKINSNIFNYKVECSTDAQLLTLSTSNRNGALSIFFLILHIDCVALSRRGSCHLESWNRSSDTLALTTTTWICFLGTH